LVSRARPKKLKLTLPRLPIDFTTALFHCMYV